MTEDNKDEPVQVSAGETKARRDGWRPKEEYSGSPEDWFDWPEFNRRSELFGKINTQGRQIADSNAKIDKLTHALREMGEHNRKLAEIQRDKALNDLKGQKKDALEAGDHGAVVEIDEQMGKVKDAVPPKIDVDDNTSGDPGQPQQHPAVAAWMANPENSWYHTNENMRALADGIAQQCMLNNVPPEQMISIVEERTRATFPAHFGRDPNVVQDKVSGASGGPANNGAKKYTINDLAPWQREVAKTFVDSGAVKDEQTYVDQLAELGDIPGQQG